MLEDTPGRVVATTQTPGQLHGIDELTGRFSKVETAQLRIVGLAADHSGSIGVGVVPTEPGCRPCRGGGQDGAAQIGFILIFGQGDGRRAASWAALSVEQAEFGQERWREGTFRLIS
jgi:hypothetical protein